MAVFDEEALRLFERFCVIAKVKLDVTAEKQWILKCNDDLSHGLKAYVIDCLSKPFVDCYVFMWLIVYVSVNSLSYFADD
jgi:hypothetical protein